MSTAILSEVEASTFLNTKSEMVTKKRASFTDDVVFSGVTITVDNYDQANDNEGPDNITVIVIHTL